jgi:GT2 family glycosyltransferase
MRRYDTLRDRDRAAIEAHHATLRERPKIALLMPLAEPGPFLREAIESVVAQLYPNWRLRIAAGADLDDATRTLLDELATRDARITVGSAPETLDIAAADFVAIVGSADRLPPHALYVVAAELNAHPDVDILYSDADEIDADGARRDPDFKPDWSPALLQSRNILDRLAVYRAALVREAGGLPASFGAGVEYALALRAAALTTGAQIRHLPHILYHARATPLSKPSPAAAEMRALRGHLAAIGDPGEVVAGILPGTWRVKHPVPSPAPRVSLIVPTRDRIELLRPCIEGLLHRTLYPNLDIIIIDNESRDPATLAFFDELTNEDRVRVRHVEGGFNFSALNNRAAALATGELIGLVNNDIDVIDPGWLEEMVGQALQPGVGVVGAKLYYSDDTIQHAGVVLGVGGVAGHSHRKFPRAAAGYRGRLHLVHDVSCVTAACMLVWKRVYDEVGGLDEIAFKVALNDVDLCLKIRAAGYRLVWTPYAELYHRESASRGSDLSSAHIERFSREVANIKERWGDVLEHDPFYSPNLSLSDENFTLAFPPRVEKPWRAYRGGTGRPAAR